MIGYVTQLWWRKCQWERFWTPRIPYIFYLFLWIPIHFPKLKQKNSRYELLAFRFERHAREPQDESRGGQSKAKHLRRANMDWCVFRLCFRHTILLYIFVTHPNISTQILKFISPFRSGFFVLQKNVINAGFRHVMDVFQGAYIFFKRLNSVYQRGDRAALGTGSRDIRGVRHSGHFTVFLWWERYSLV